MERSAAWLKASYNAQMDSLLTYGSEETNIVLNYYLSGGATNTDPNASLGGGISNTQVTDDTLNNLYDDITEAECKNGDTEYRAIFIKNDGTGTATGVKIWIAAQPDADRTFKEEIHIGVEAPVSDAIQTIPDESTAPSGITFSQPASEAEGLLIGDLAPGECYGIWIRRGPFPAETITHVSPASFQVQSKYQAAAFTLKYNVLKAIYYVSVVIVRDRTQVLDVTEACPALILSKWGTRWTFPDFARSPAYDVVDPPPTWPSTVTKQMEQVYDKTIVDFPWVNVSPWEEARDQGLTVKKWGAGVALTDLRYKISGVTRDQNGLPLGYCEVWLIAADTLRVAQKTQSDGNGNYSFHVPDPDQEYLVRAFKEGTPDRWGTTEHTLKGTAV